MAIDCEYFPPSHDDELTRLKARIAVLAEKFQNGVSNGAIFFVNKCFTKKIKFFIKNILTTWEK